MPFKEPARLGGAALNRGAQRSPGDPGVCCAVLRRLSIALAAASTIGCGTSSPAPSAPAIEADNPTIPIGFDAYRQWDRWPYLRLATRTSMRSTYDRAGGNEDADASHFLRLSSARAVAFDVEGNGVLAFTRFNHDHGSPWHFVADGRDVTVTSAGVGSPGPFPEPLAWSYATTQGADVIGVPIPFQRSLEVDYENMVYGTGYFIDQQFPQGARNLSQPVTSWKPEPPPQDVLDLVARAGQDLSPPGAIERTGSVALAAGTEVPLFDAPGPAMIRALTLTIPASDAAALEGARIRVTWDGRAIPSVDAPVPLFFGAGTLYNRASAEYLVKAFPVNIRFAGGQVVLATYFPMPFSHAAHVTLAGGSTPISKVEWSVKTVPYADPAYWVGYFHATYVDHGAPSPGVDLTLLDTRGVEGSQAWCGQIVGTSFVFSDQGDLGTLEGDPRFFFDDSQTPQVQGTGTEEWGGGGDYWQNGQTTTLPFYGHPVGAPGGTTPSNADDAIESAYRYLLSDLMPFGRNARVQLEHGGVDDSTQRYRSVVSWYGAPGACLVPTDALHVSDPADETKHRYVSPTASSVDTVSSRYELGVDHVGDTVVYPETQDTGRHMTGASEFTLTIAPKNFGVLLRRTLDYSYPDQRAEVFVADDAAGTAGAAFADAGPWYLAGSNTCVYADPASLPPPAQPVLETSNRRWRDDEFLIPRALTDGRSAIRVRIVFSPKGAPLTPDAGAPASAWSEFRYAAYVWTLPGGG